jgi:hypothetical protein
VPTPIAAASATSEHHRSLVTFEPALDLSPRSARIASLLIALAASTPYFPEDREIAVIALVALPQPA